MTHKTMELGDLCNVMTGAPITRAKKLADGEAGTTVKVLTSRAMESGRIADSELTLETVSKVKESLFSKEGDVIVKASTPYDCVYIDKDHEGLLVTSFAIILRAKAKSPVDMRYLATYLNQPQAREMIQNLGIGETIKLIKKAAISRFDVPIIPKEQQARLAALFESTQKRKEHCLSLIAKSDELLEAEFTRTIANQQT